ncbi:hypothetical protein GMA13_05855 [Ruminococcus sp. zg-924]|nr:hypothetical protein [Ruminococcus sp. zg-924]MCQ4115126.1 hypothetical protein [Ruminococcus sp. zg-921]
MTSSYKMALGGIFSALAVVSMLISYLVPTATYACPALAGVMLIPVVIEVGKGWATCAYAAVSILSFLLLADKEMALMFTAFFGFYPILKAVLEKHFSPILYWFLKIAVFSVCMAGVFFISIYVLGIPRDSFTIFGVYLPWVFLVIGEVVFVVYDIALTRVISAYVRVWRKKLLKRFL